MTVRIIFMLIVFGSLFNDAFAQRTVKVFAAQKSVVEGAAGANMDELLTRYEMYGFSGSVLVVKDD